MTAPSGYFEPDIETMPRPELEALQEERLRDALTYAYERSPIVGGLWRAAGASPDDVSRASDLTGMPFLTKDAIRAFRDEHHDPYGGLLCVPADRVRSVYSSSGTTGTPTLFPERFDWSNLNLSCARPFWGLGLRPGDLMVASPSMTSRGPTAQGAHIVGAVPIVVEVSVATMPAVLDVVRRYRPAYMHMSGPIVGGLLELSQQHDLREAMSSFKGVGFAGEPLGPRMRRRMTDDWGIELYMWSSAGDVGVAFECPEHDGMHLWEDTLIAECLDVDRDVAVSEGEIGELVVTSIDDDVAPLIRYRTGDLVRLSRDTCRCGRTHSRQWVLGRKDDQVVIDGKSVMPIEIWEAVEEHAETAAGLFQIVRPTKYMDELKLRVGYQVAAGHSTAGLADRLADSIEAAVAIRPRIELLTVGEMQARRTSQKNVPRVVPA